MALEIANVKRKIALIDAIEAGEKYPTFKQLDTLADMYKVPRWVFISDKLPEKYDFTKSVPAFRQFADRESTDFSDPKIRGVLAKVRHLRDLIIEIQNDLGDPIEDFNPPELVDDIAELAKTIRKWLGVDRDLSFSEWKRKLEQKGVFVFMTSKYRGWSHVAKDRFRGLSIYQPVLPIVIINSSDAKKAQSFTLLHELGHLARRENALDSWDQRDKNTENWCDELAGEILMPTEQFLEAVADAKIANLEQVKNLAKNFSVSVYACLVKLRSSKIISQESYLQFENNLQEEYRKIQETLKAGDGGPARDRVKEVFDQYGRIYATALFHAYSNNEIGLHKLCKAFDLKRVSQVMQLRDKL